MDFRRITPGTVRWSLPASGKPAARGPDGSRVLAQTPQCACRVSLVRAGMYRLDLALSPAHPTHVAFREWLAELEDAASEAGELRQWRGNRGRSTSVYNNSMRLTAFSDTLAFDAAGQLSGDLLGAQGCTCLVELQGAWATEGRWGLRWRVVQVKFDAAYTPPPAQCELIDDMHEHEQPMPAFAFVDE